MHENMNHKIKIISDERELEKIKSQNIHSLNRRLRNKRQKIDIFSQSKIKYKCFNK